MRYIKKVAENCKKCGVSFSEEPRYNHKRALCGPCYHIVAKECNLKHAPPKQEEEKMYVKYKQYIEINREPVHKARAKKLRGMKERQEWLDYFKIRWEEIKAEKPLWEWVTREMTEYHKARKERVAGGNYHRETFEEFENEIN